MHCQTEIDTEQKKGVEKNLPTKIRCKWNQTKQRWQCDLYWNGLLLCVCCCRDSKYIELIVIVACRYVMVVVVVFKQILNSAFDCLACVYIYTIKEIPKCNEKNI